MSARIRRELGRPPVPCTDVLAALDSSARVPLKASSPDNSSAPGIGGMSVAESVSASPWRSTCSAAHRLTPPDRLQIHALRQIKGASDVLPDAQVLGGTLDDYRSNLVLSMVQAGELDGVNRDAAQKDPVAWAASVTEQQMIMRIVSAGDPNADVDIQALAGACPPPSCSAAAHSLTSFPPRLGRPQSSRSRRRTTRPFRRCPTGRPCPGGSTSAACARPRSGSTWPSARWPSTTTSPPSCWTTASSCRATVSPFVPRPPRLAFC